jgi:carboxypeptidase PM20D1
VEGRREAGAQRRERIMKRILQAVLLLVSILGGVVVVRALLLKPTSEEVLPPVTVEVREGAVERFSSSLTFPTISHGDASLFDSTTFLAFRDYLVETFPLVHRHLSWELVGGHSLLYSWAGTNPQLGPVILMAHYDVVPIEPGTEDDWTHPPFSGLVLQDEVWGRGAMDDKSSLMGILEGAETLLEGGFQPTRGLLFSFGHDEETGGLEGARAVADLLEERGIQGAFALDEGMAIVEGSIPGVDGPVALIGLAEKGYVSIQLSAEVEGGHSSTPPAVTAVGSVARAVSRLEENRPEPRLEGPTRLFLDAIAPDQPFAMKLVMGNLWLFKGAVTRMMASSPETDASVRTTTAPTLLQAGVKDNILPSQAFAVVNFRIIPGETSEDVIRHVEETVDDPNIRVTIYQDHVTEPSPVSSLDGFGYGELRATVQEVFPGTAIAPFLTLGGTDSKHFVGLVDDVYRFAPIRFNTETSSGIHGTDEKISVGGYLDMVRFYTRLMERTGAG